MNVAVRIECAAQHELYLSDNRHYYLYSELIGVIKDLRRRVLVYGKRFAADPRYRRTHTAMY